MMVLVFPEPCFECYCKYDPWHDRNVFDCQNQGLTALPERLESGTQSLLLSGNSITRICGDVSQLENVSRIELQHNSIEEICSESMEQLVSRRDYIDISHNNISYLPRTIENAPNSTQLKIGNNPYACNCDMLWMVHWFFQSNTKYIPSDWTCVYGKSSVIGLPIYMLTKSNLGCIPLPIALICGTSVGVIILVVLIIMFFRNLDLIKFQLFLHFNIRVNEDQAEIVDSMEFDAFVAYKYE